MCLLCLMYPSCSSAVPLCSVRIRCSGLGISCLGLAREALPTSSSRSSDLHFAMTPSHDRNSIADCILNAFNALPQKCKPRTLSDGRREWVPLAGIVLSKGNV